MSSFPPLRSLLLTLLVAGHAAAQGSESAMQDPPIEVGLREKVRVQLVLVDFVVVDRDGRTVPGLAIDDFSLKVDGEKTKIASLDLDCPIGAADELDLQSADLLPPGANQGTPRKVVLVFDYDHMTNEDEAYARVLRLLDRWPVGLDEHMLASFGEVLRVETPFTADRDELRWALRRMRNDRDLYGRGAGPVTEKRFFERMLSLMEILQRYEGRKTIVLLSGPFAADGWNRDQAQRELSSVSTIARAAIYPVDTGGLRVATDPAGSSLGGPAELRRLAIETGGRMTSETNDITLAYAKAQRDMRCTYTLGVEDTGGKLDDKRRLTIKLNKRKDLRVIYAQYFFRQSAESRAKSLRRTAGLAPELFESSDMRASHFVIGVQPKGSWRTVFVLQIGLEAEELHAEGRRWQLTGFLRKRNGTIVESFERDLQLSGPTVLYEPLEVAPGEYAFSAVISASDATSPRSATRLVKLAPPPLEGPFLLGPILGWSPAASRSGVGFQPALDNALQAGQPLESMTVLCLPGAQPSSGEAAIERWIVTAGGDRVQSYERRASEFAGRGGTVCTEVVDHLPTMHLPQGSYEFRAVGEVGGLKTRESHAIFSIVAAEPGKNGR